LVALAIVGVAAVLYVIGSSLFKPKDVADLTDLARGPLQKLVVAKAPVPGPTLGFTDAAGKPVTLADFKGQVVVLNLWATWCGPCKVEMPTLARLQAAYAGKPVKVVAVSTDREAAITEARAFIAGNAPLAFYGGGEKLPFQIEPHVLGFPTTLIFDASGHERARMSGDADWATPEAHKVIDRMLDDKD
jgi:thiol-disulfide isomerase/thioredoxin